MGALLRLEPGRRGGRDQGGPPTAGVEPLWRELTGRRLRRERLRRGETLAESAARAGVSTQYLSELERGLKDPSSEILAAVAGSVGLSLLDLTTAVAHDLRAAPAPPVRPRGPVALAA